MNQKLKKYGFEGNYTPVSEEVIQTGINLLKVNFERYFTITYIEENFVIPKYYIDFITSISSYICISKQYHTLYSINEVVKGTKGFLLDYEEQFINRKQKKTPLSTDYMWIMIGWWSDKHDLILCCDKNSAYWGKIYDVWDDHPWSSEDLTIAETHNDIESYASYLLQM